MARKRYTSEQIIGMLRVAEIQMAKGLKVKAVCRHLGITEQTYYRWRKEYCQRSHSGQPYLERST